MSDLVRIDKLIGQYYRQLGRNNYFDPSTGHGKFLEFVIKEEYNDVSIDDELGDECSHFDCGYVAFDPDFPVHQTVAILMNWNTENDFVIFYILQHCYKYNKVPDASAMQSKLLSLDIIENKQDTLPDSINVVAMEFESKLLSHIPELPNGTEKHIMNKFKRIALQEQYISMSHLRDDLETDADSFIIDEIILSNHKALQPLRTNIFNILQSIVYNYYIYNPFNLQQFQYDMNDDTYSDEIETLWCNHYPDGICSFYLNGEQLKAIDYANKFPLFISIIDAYLRYNIDEIKTFWLKGYTAEKEQYYVDKLISHSQWLNLKENVFREHNNTEYIVELIGEMNNVFKHSLAGFQCGMLQYVIYDSYDIYTRYTIAFNMFIHSISHKTAKPSYEHLPLQIDFWIIPRVLMKRTTTTVFNEEEVFDKTFARDYPYANNGTSVQIQCVGKWKHNVWDIQDNLNDANYTEGEDYWMLDDDEKCSDYSIETLLTNMKNIWKQNKGWQHNEGRRYIMIVDRRNPQHVLNEQLIDNSDCTQTWNDRMYLLYPKRYNTVSKDCEYKMNECFLQNTLNYLLPIRGKDDEHEIDHLSAHFSHTLFILSYHLYCRNKVNIYWYSQHGVIRFFMEDVIDLWPKYFKKIDNGYQTLSDYSFCILKQTLAEYRLKDEQFDAFQKQIYGTVL